MSVSSPRRRVSVIGPRRKVHQGSTQFYILITTYNRPGSLLRLLNDIKQQSAGISIRITVYDDCSSVDYSAVQQYLAKEGWSYVRTDKNYGKQGYTALMTLVLRDASLSRARYCLFIQDDMRLCDNFFPTASKLWDSILDAKKATLFLLRDSVRCSKQYTTWTGRTSVVEGHVERTWWVDAAAFMFVPHLIKYLPNSTIPAPGTKWFSDEHRGSGFGMRVSKELYAKGLGMFRTRTSLVAHVEGSVMNVTERIARPMHTVDFNSGPQRLSRLEQDAASATETKRSVATKSNQSVTICLATIPSRECNLNTVVQSLLPQTSDLRVYLNEYDSVPSWLSGITGITTVLGGTDGNIGDVGKFFWVDKITSEYLFTCDDDIQYPPDYVDRMLWFLKRYQKSVCGVHGAIIREPVVNYYRSRSMIHFSSQLSEPVRVNVLGTGTTALHVGHPRLTIKDFSIPNMADIWLAIAAKKQSVPMYCVSRTANWLRPLSVNNKSKSIYKSSVSSAGDAMDTCSLQTAMIKQNSPWALE